MIEGASLEAHLGNYSDWKRRRAAPAEAPRVAAPPPPAPPTASSAERGAGKERERARRQLARRVETLEADVSKIETELAAVRADLAGDHAGDWQKLHALADRERELDALLARRIAEWETAGAELLDRPAKSSD